MLRACPKCGRQLLGSPRDCDVCGHVLSDVPPDLTVDPSLGERMMMPVGLSGWAIAAGYAGLLSPLGIFAPLAIFCGIMAIRDMKRNPKLHGMGRAVFGLVMGGLGSVLLLIGLGAIAIQHH